MYRILEIFDEHGNHYFKPQRKERLFFIFPVWFDINDNKFPSYTTALMVIEALKGCKQIIHEIEDDRLKNS